jgi:hypothetical protein
MLRATVRRDRLLLITACLGAACTDTHGTDDPFGTQSGTDATSGASTSSTTDGETTDDLTTGITATTTAGTTTTGDTTAADSSTGAPSECGNGVVEGDELCDGTDFGGETCASQGFDEGDLLCNANCKVFSTEQCFVCGNMAVEGVEACDGSVPMGVTCESEGFTEGTIACGADCQYDTAGCSLCGNGVAEGAEECDDTDLGGQTCESLNLIGGDLGCVAASCSYDFTGCQSFMETFETGVIETYWTATGNATWIADDVDVINGSFSAGSGTITHNQTSGMSVMVDFAAGGEISFWHEESTESCCDHLEFYIDNVMQDEWSGTNAPAQADYPVAAGVHTFEWRYAKDLSVNTGQDQVWVDDILATGGALVP